MRNEAGKFADGADRSSFPDIQQRLLFVARLSQGVNRIFQILVIDRIDCKSVLGVNGKLMDSVHPIPLNILVDLPLNVFGHSG